MAQRKKVKKEKSYVDQVADYIKSRRPAGMLSTANKKSKKKTSRKMKEFRKGLGLKD